MRALPIIWKRTRMGSLPPSEKRPAPRVFSQFAQCLGQKPRLAGDELCLGKNRIHGAVGHQLMNLFVGLGQPLFEFTHTANSLRVRTCLLLQCLSQHT